MMSGATAAIQSERLLPHVIDAGYLRSFAFVPNVSDDAHADVEKSYVAVPERALLRLHPAVAAVVVPVLAVVCSLRVFVDSEIAAVAPVVDVADTADEAVGTFELVEDRQWYRSSVP